MKRINIKCPYCGSRALLRPASVVYGAKAVDPNAPCYVFTRYPACDAYMAAHGHSGGWDAAPPAHPGPRRLEPPESGLTSKRQALVEDNLLVIEKVISRYIEVNEDVCGLDRDGLYQEGAVALCKAASAYDGTSARFSTYAATVVRNHLYNHCKAVNTGRRNLPSVSLDMDGPDDDRPPPFPEPSVPDSTDALISELDISAAKQTDKAARIL